MDLVLVICRALVAFVFTVAAVTKLADRQALRMALDQFGVPLSAVPVAAGLLPALELAVAASLIPAATAVPGAVVAVALLAVFTAGVGQVVARPGEVDCRCFGGVSAGPVGRGTIARNLALLLPAALVAAAGPGAGVTAWI